MIVAGEVRLHGSGARVLPLHGATPVQVHWSSEARASTDIRPLTDPMLTGVWGDKLTRITLDVTTARSCTVTIEPDPISDKDPQ